MTAFDYPATLTAAPGGGPDGGGFPVPVWLVVVLIAIVLAIIGFTWLRRKG